MQPKTFSGIVGVIFLIIAVLHLFRIILGWEATIAGWEMPMWFSWPAFIVAGFLAYQSFRFQKIS
ncbi:hypothetical protein HY967_01265 [Candidatus Jorgensenbacteria bacterium]|nr:hypothetical protein [Candidatus Jorgensenbacteria bacterium]